MVNILVYDYHSGGSEAGPITTIPWLRDVISYSLTQIPPEKIVIGLPMYGYNWQLQSTSPDPYTYAEFMTTIGSDKRFTHSRDALSAELKYSGPGQEAWLSDSVSIKEYVKATQALGLNRFILWQIGGMDEKLF